MAKKYFAGSQDDSLRGLRETLISRLLQDAEGLEVHPHRRAGIGHAAVCEGIGCEQVAKLIMNNRFRNRLDGQQCDTK